MTETNADERGQEFVEECLAKWTPRFVANGVDPNDMQRMVDRIDSWDEWCAEFRAFGDSHAELGEAAEERGDLESAGTHFTQAAMYYHFGSHVWHEDEDERIPTHQRAVESYLRGGQYLDPPVERIEAPYPEGGFDIPGNLRVPEDGPDGTPGDSPLVILLPGSDSIKEELDAYGVDLLERGLATLAIDGAGQGETWHNQGMTADYYKLVSAVVDYVKGEELAGVDTSRLGVYGVSLGGFYASHVAANESRIDACVGFSGKFTVGPTSSWATDMHKQQYKWACKTDSMVVVDEITEAMSLRDDIGEVSCPLLAITGALDVITTPEQTKRIADGAPKGEFVCYDDGNHVCNNITYKARPYAADWLRRKLV